MEFLKRGFEGISWTISGMEEALKNQHVNI